MHSTTNRNFENSNAEQAESTKAESAGEAAAAEETEQALAGQVSQAWINFAKNGVPSAEGLPEWEPYTREGGAAMILDTESRMAYHHDQKLLSILVPDYQY